VLAAAPPVAVSDRPGVPGHAGIICYSCRQVTCAACAARPDTVCSECGKRTVPCLEHYYAALHGLHGVVLMADPEQQAEVLRYWRKRGDGQGGKCTAETCGAAVIGNAYIVGWPGELRCERCARAFLAALLYDSTTVNDFLQQYGEARLAAILPSTVPQLPPSSQAAPPQARMWTNLITKQAVWLVLGLAAIAAIILAGVLIPDPFQVNRAFVRDRIDWNSDFGDLRPAMAVLAQVDKFMVDLRARDQRFLIVEVFIPETAVSSRWLERTAWALLGPDGSSRIAAGGQVFPLEYRMPSTRPDGTKIVIVFAVRETPHGLMHVQHGSGRAVAFRMH
jgi:hypothetical protein